jgi:DNA-binding NarL/FixJ family response regulator
LCREDQDLSLLDAVSLYQKLPPVIVIADGSAARLRQLACQHGAAAFVPKPLTVVEMEWAIEELCPGVRKLPVSCDFWGHPRAPRKYILNR